MINYINRDEQIHVDLFVKIFKEILVEYPEYNTKELHQFINETLKRAVELEVSWAKTVIGDEIEGLVLQEVEDYIKFYANVRANQLGTDRPYEGYRQNPLRWIKAYETVDLGKTDFFEQKSRQYAKTTDANGFDEL
jgi:ribonucleoside-diphosphate reductase beta chain